jgi:signal transduction histidine kinase
MRAVEFRRQGLRLELARRLLRLMSVLAVGLLLLRLDRGPGVLVPGAVLLALLVLGLRVLRRPWRVQNAYMAGLGWALVAAEAWWSFRWEGGGLPPALVLLSVNGLLFSLAWSLRLGCRLFVAGELVLGLVVWTQPGLEALESRHALGWALGAAALQGMAWAYGRVQRHLMGIARRVLRGLKAEEESCAKLLGAMLDNLELPLRWARLEPLAFSEEAAALRRGLEEARRLRAGLDASPKPEVPAAPARPWRAVGLVILCGCGAVIAADLAGAPPGRLPAGFSLAALAIAAAALCLGLRSSLPLSAVGLALLAARVASGPGLEKADEILAGNLAALWLLLAYFLAPAAQAQEARLRRLEEQARRLAVQLRVRRRLVGILFHAAANHVATLNALAALQEAGAAQAGDLERFRRIHGRLAALVAGARRRLFNDEAFDAESLVAVDLAEQARLMEELFRERLRAKGLVLAMEVPAGLAVKAVPELLGEAVLGHLLGRAIELSPRDGVVGLRAWRQATRVCLLVRTQGPGFNAGGWDAVRRWGGMWKSRDREESEAELGLSLAREYVERMGGRLELAAAPGGGAEARVWLEAAS